MATFIVNTSAPKGGDMHYFHIGDTVPDWAFEHLGEHTYSGDDAPAPEESEPDTLDEETVEDETDDSEDNGEELAAGNDVDDLDFTGADPEPKKTTRARRTTKKK
ncbi:hypothetical protein [Bowdeniella massiliensis]|uniref:hypothetical protein n=1 Tax=Bowdeniella massiliensis TaxID=2932264 RepID=UPI0020294FBF|nr:hypothetical protein [Bowdeniella massiliensis]